MRRIWFARCFIVLLLIVLLLIALLLACLIFGWATSGPVFPRVVGTIIDLVWNDGMFLKIRQQQRLVNA